MSKKGIALFLAFLMLFSIFTPQMTTYAATTENIEEVTTSEDTNENDLEQSTEEPENTGQNTEITSTESVEESTEQSTEQSTEAEPDAQAAPTGAPVTLSDDGMSDVVLETFTKAAGGTQYYGGVKYKNTTVAHFTIDGQPAFCMQHGVTAPTTGTVYESNVYEDENVRRVLYYGWQGQSQWSGFDGNENKGIVITSLALSHYYHNSPANVNTSYYIEMGLKDFIDYCNANSIPDSRISFSTDSVKAYRSGDMQRTDDITINGWSGNNLSFTLQDGVKAVTNDGGIYTGNVTLNGGTTFHLEAPLTVNVDWSTGTIGGSVKKFNAIIWYTSPTYQTAGGWELKTDPLGTTSLAVDWLDVGNLQINKYNGLGELIDGAKFRVQALNDGNTYDQIVTVTNGSLLLENILSGDYKVTEVQTPNSVSGTGYLLDPNNEYTVTIEPGATKTLNVVNYEPSGQITLTKRDSETGTAQGSATLQGAVYQLSASTNIVRANGEIIYTAGQVIGNAATDANGQIVWNGLYPGGSYAIKEIQPSDGYNLDTSTYIVELNFKDSSTAVVTASRVSYEKVIRSDIELSKFGTDSVDTENTKKIPLKGVIFSIQSLTTNQKWYMVTNENGYIDSVTDKIYSKVNTTNGTIKVDASSVVTRNSRGMFPRDKYLITELNTPAGYMPIQPMTVVLDKQSYKYQWILEDKDIISALRVEKTDAETGQVIPIANTSFHLYDAQGKQIKMVASRYPTTQYIDEFATDESGTFTLPEKLQIGTYYLEEVNAPDGYLKGQRMKFDITRGHDWSQPFTIQYANTPAKGKIKIVKTDSETAEPVEGAVYEIYADGDIKTGDNTIRNTSGELIDTVTTDDTGTALSQELYLGNYTVKEKETPDGYKLDTEEHKVSVEYADAVTPVVIATLEVEDEPNNIFIQKIDSETEKTLPRATLQLIDADGNIIDEWTTTDEESHKISHISKPGTYILHEEKAPDGYLKADDIEINYEGGIIETPFVMKDVPIQAEIEKIDAKTEKSLPGATLQLIDADKKVVDEWTTDGKPHSLYAIAKGTYTLHEKEVPDGYVCAEDMEIEIKETADTQKFVMKDDPIQAEIEKIDAKTEKSLPGATLQLIDADKKVVDEWTTDGKPHSLYAIAKGTYTLHEKEVPDGYVCAEDMEIEIKETADTQEFVMEDDPIQAEIEKVDYENGDSLPGATLQLIDKDKNIVDEWTTDGKPHSLYAIAKGTYTLHEKEVPNGYVRAKDMEIEIIETADMQQFVMKDKRVGGIVTSMTKPTPEKETPGTINTKMHLKTGDTNNVLLWLLIFAGSGAVIAVLILSRKKGKRSRIGIFLLMFVMLAASTPNKVYAAEPEITKEHEYTSKNKEEEYTGFKDTIEEDGRKYNLSGITYDIEKTTPEKEKKMLTKEVDSDLIPVSEEYTPEQTITEDNVTYTLNDCTVLDDSEEVKNYTSYVDYLDEAAIPDSKVITVTGEYGEKLQLQGKVAKKEVISNGEWLNTQITITFDHYDSGEYVWQGETIYNSSNPLEGHYAELLQSVGADSNTHRITSTQWSGDAYEVDGVTYRDAIANVQYFVPYTRATYAASQEYVKYRATYAAETEVDSKTNFTYDLKATATYELDKSLTVKQIVIMAGVGLLIIVVLIVLILYVVSRRKKDKEPQKRREVKVSYCIRKGSGKAVEKKWKKEIKNAPDK